MSNDVVVSVCTMVYNHENFIAQTIEGVLAQKCSFKLEMILGEDCSTDNSRAIIKKYESLYPDIIKPIYHTHNIGAKKNSVLCLQACTGKYIALCEGDDYWTNPNKLQMQFDFMEAHQDFTMCFTDAAILVETEVDDPNSFEKIYKDEFIIDDFIMTEKVFVPTATLFFRNILTFPLPDYFVKAFSGDVALHLLLTDKGKAKHLPFVTAVYRHHAGGITKVVEARARAFENLFDLFVGANKHFNFKYEKVFRKKLFEMSQTRLMFGSRNLKGIAKLKHAMTAFKQYFRYSDGINFKEVLYYLLVLFFPALLKTRSRN